ncbi:MAG: sulfotransferase domain-containing protein [Anaerolineales bacterium]|jgi:hypothetical protein
MKNFFQSLRKQGKVEFITIVSGLPRSGTSMMMKMLEAGGIPPFTDHIRTPDDDNPKGYYEFERVKKLPDGDTAWLRDARGKAVKVISALLEHLPTGYAYRVLFMQRKMDEILASQKKMLVRSGKPTDQVSDEQMAKMYTKHLAKVSAWLAEQDNFSVVYLDYNQMLVDPQKYASQVSQFLGSTLDPRAMAAIVDPNLYRQRK